ncbi:MAG: hypothetical protein H6707_19840 [Deltaproteobacteria bacterium]|nr:hypothetical protein [Deltaproteobacteria bacterium]
MHKAKLFALILGLAACGERDADQLLAPSGKAELIDVVACRTATPLKKNLLNARYLHQSFFDVFKDPAKNVGTHWLRWRVPDDGRYTLHFRTANVLTRESGLSYGWEDDHGAAERVSFAVFDACQAGSQPLSTRSYHRFAGRAGQELYLRVAFHATGRVSRGIGGGKTLEIWPGDRTQVNYQVRALPEPTPKVEVGDPYSRDGDGTLIIHGLGSYQFDSWAERERQGDAELRFRWYPPANLDAGTFRISVASTRENYVLGHFYRPLTMWGQPVLPPTDWRSNWSFDAPVNHTISYDNQLECYQRSGSVAEKGSRSGIDGVYSQLSWDPAVAEFPAARVGLVHAVGYKLYTVDKPVVFSIKPTFAHAGGHFRLKIEYAGEFDAKCDARCGH